MTRPQQSNHSTNAAMLSILSLTKLYLYLKLNATARIVETRWQRGRNGGEAGTGRRSAPGERQIEDARVLVLGIPNLSVAPTLTNTMWPLGGLHPVERCPVHAEGVGKVHHGLAGIHALQRFSALVRRQLGLSPEPNALCLRTFAPFASAGDEKVCSLLRVVLVKNRGANASASPASCRLPSPAQGTSPRHLSFECVSGIFSGWSV
jgi:hypothetical protein